MATSKAFLRFDKGWFSLTVESKFKIRLYMYNRLIPSFLVIILLVLSTRAEAQIALKPLEYNATVASEALKTAPQKKSINLDTLPFVEDFAYAGPFPTPERWVDDHVFVNNTLAENPPSIGVATFDGLDNTGTPYRTDGAGDTLTSVGINLDLGSVTDLYLTFFVQRAGFGDQPEASDSLVLEFKSESGEWTQVRGYAGTDNILADSLRGFMFEAVQINAVDYLFDDFQFRFRNTSSGRGFIDLWHVDVIRLINGQTPAETYRDIAFQFPTQSILERYTAMPTKHFLDNTSSHLRSSFNFDVVNHFDQARPLANETSEVSITELNSGEVVVDPDQFLTNSSLFNIPADTAVSIDVILDIDFETDTYDDQDELNFQTLFVIDPSESDNELGLLDNNFLRGSTIISNYFAYDDGSAETSIQARGSGTQVAVEFETSSEKDTIGAIQIMMPHILGDISDQFFNLKVWVGNLTSEPLFEGELLNVVYVDSFVDSLQGFSTYRLEDTFSGELQAVEIPANTKFYIGWEQVSDNFDDAIPVGFDINAPDSTGTYQFFRTTDSDWTSFSKEGVVGAVMIRPVMGADNAISTSVSNTEQDQKITIYPNPSTGLIKIESLYGQNLSAQINVFNVAGQRVHNQAFQEEIDLSNLPTGIYFMDIIDRNKTILTREKLIIQ